MLDQKVHLRPIYIRHFLAATIAKYMGNIHRGNNVKVLDKFLKDYEIYLKSFTNHCFDEANELVVS